MLLAMLRYDAIGTQRAYRNVEQTWVGTK